MKSLELTYLDHQFCFLYSNLILLNATSLIPDIFVMSSTCKSIVNSKSFQRLIIFTILLAGIVVGVQTFKVFASENVVVLDLLDSVILGIFVIRFFFLNSLHQYINLLIIVCMNLTSNI